MAVATGAAGRRFFPRVHWSAVIAGVALALAAHIVLGLIGAAIGLAAEPADSRTIGAGAAFWALLTPFVASLLGAWLAIKLSGEEDRAAANVHGILVWCIGLILGALFLAGTIGAGAMSAGTAASGNLASAQRITGAGRPSRPEAERRADQAGKAGAAAAGGAALAAIAGLLGAVVGSGVALRGGARGRGLGWRFGLQRRDEQRMASHAESRPYGGGTTYPEQPRMTRPGEPPRPGEPMDPYHH